MLASFSAKGLRISALTAWVLVAFIGSQFVAVWLLIGLVSLIPALAGLNLAVLTVVSTALAYVLALSVVLVVHRLRNTSEGWSIFGVHRSLSWMDIGLALLALLPYYLISYGLIIGLSDLLPFVDPMQRQSIPYQNLVLRYEYIIAFIALVVLAPVAEELMFRGYFLGKLKSYINPWVAVVFTALVFGLLHLPGQMSGGSITLQWSAAIDTFALGLMLGTLRLWSGSVWAGILLHMLKNAIAYFALFVYPSLAGTM